MNFMQKDSNGVWRIGAGARGCKHCGKVEEHYASNGLAVWSHPGVTCCRKALEDQLRWRKADLENARNQYRQAERAIHDAEDKVNRAAGAERNALNVELAKVRAALPLKRQRLLLMVDGDPDSGVVGVKNEIAELEEQLASWR